MDIGTAFILVIVLAVVLGGVLFVLFGGVLGGKRGSGAGALDPETRPAHTAVDLDQSRRGEREGVPRD